MGASLMSICEDLYRPVLIKPRRIREPTCTAFERQNRAVNFFYALNLTPDPNDNDPASAQGAWSLGDLPVKFAAQDVDTRGDDVLLVAIANRVYRLDWKRYQDEWNWETFYPIYRQLILGPIPGSREEQEGGTFDLRSLKRFRRLAFRLATPPTDDPVQSQYKATVVADGDAGFGAGAIGYRRTQQNAEVKIAQRGYAFLVTLEHEANEDFPLDQWVAEWEELGGRRRNDPIVTT